MWLVLWPSAAAMFSFMQKKEREKRKTEKTAMQDDNSHLAELYVGFVENNLIAKRTENYIDEFWGC